VSKDFIDLMYLFSCGARGTTPVLTHEIDMSKIYQLAKTQGVWETTFLAIKRLYDNGSLKIAKAEYERLNKEVLLNVYQSTLRDHEIYRTIESLEKHGIECCVLKGISVATLYHDPGCRISLDTDILISEKLEKKAVRLLKQMGYETEKRPTVSAHVNCYHPIAGSLELHVKPYNKFAGDVWFNNQFTVEEKYNNIPASNLKALGINDGLKFIAIHTIKHFISGGVGLRHVMDLLLYMSFYYDDIDWIKFLEIMDYLRYKKFIDHMIGIGICYLGFTEQQLYKCQFDMNTIDSILLDIEQGGIFGKNEAQRHDCYKFYTELRFSRYQNGDAKKYLSRLKPLNIIPSLFPNYIIMSQKYHYLSKSPILLPFAWLHRFLKLLAGIIHGRKSITTYTAYNQPESNTIIERRLDLIRELNMV